MTHPLDRPRQRARLAGSSLSDMSAIYMSVRVVAAQNLAPGRPSRGRGMMVAFRLLCKPVQADHKSRDITEPQDRQDS
jgi:hypothetical protein